MPDPYKLLSTSPPESLSLSSSDEDLMVNIVRTWYFLNSYFNQFHPHLKTITYLSTDTPLIASCLLVMTLRFSQTSTFTNSNGLVLGLLLTTRTKHGSIRWPLPQQHPLQSSPQHPPCPLATNHGTATHRADLPPHRKWAASSWTTANNPHPVIPPELLTSREYMILLPLSAHQWPFLHFIPNQNSEAWEESLVLSSSLVCSPARLSLANHPRWLCSHSHWPGYLHLGTVEGCIQAMPPYPWWSEQSPQQACWLVRTTPILVA